MDREIDGPLILLWFTDQGKGRGAWWRSSDPGHSLSGFPDSQNEMRLSNKLEHHKHCLWKACNIQQKSHCTLWSIFINCTVYLSMN